MHNDSAVDGDGLPCWFDRTVYDGTINHSAEMYLLELSLRGFFYGNPFTGSDAPPTSTSSPEAYLPTRASRRGFCERYGTWQPEHESAIRLLPGRWIPGQFAEQVRREHFLNPPQTIDGELLFTGPAWPTVPGFRWKSRNHAVRNVGPNGGDEPVRGRPKLPGSIDDRYLTLQIDRMAPRSTVQRALDTHLSEQRADELSGSRAYKSSDFENWTRAALLPTLDLLRWADLKQANLTTETIAESLLLSAADETALGLRVRGNTSPATVAEAVRKLTTAGSLRRGQGQARPPYLERIDDLLRVLYKQTCAWFEVETGTTDTPPLSK